MRNFGVIVASHGYFARESVKVVEMIAGKQENVVVASLVEDMSIKDYKIKFDEKLKELEDKSEYIIAFVDIYGGTPFNTVVRSILEGKKIIAYSGFSLPVLLEVLTNDKLSEKEAVKLIEDTQKFALSRIDQIVETDNQDLEL